MNENQYEVLYEDDFLIAVNKPQGIFVHRSKLDTRATVFMLQEIRNQIGQKVYPVHRLDRKTSGVLLFAKNTDTQRKMNSLFLSRSIQKKYLAVVRGYTEDELTIDYPLKTPEGKIQDACTHFVTLSRVEIPMCSWKFPTSRYSLLEAKPITGRMHQIRRHLSHIFHPIIGDRPHGCNKQNKFFLEQFALSDMLLHASEIQFIHPETGFPLCITAKKPSEFMRMLDILGFNN